MTWQRRGGIVVWSGLAKDDPRHGTTAGHRAHRRARERPCFLCAEAWRAYKAEYQLRGGNTCADCGSAITRDATRCHPCAGRAWRTGA